MRTFAGPVATRHTDPRDQTIDVYSLRERRWSLLHSFAAEPTMLAEPFEAIEIPLARLWVAPSPGTSG